MPIYMPNTHTHAHIRTPVRRDTQIRTPNTYVVDKSTRIHTHMWVCVCERAYVCWACIWACVTHSIWACGTHSCAHTYVINACARSHTYAIHTDTHIYTHIHTYMIDTSTHIHTLTPTYIRDTHIHTYTHTHAHIHM